MKKYALFAFTICGALAITIFTQKHAEKNAAPIDNQWHTYQKAGEDKVTSYKTPKDELKKLNLTNNIEKKSKRPERSIASVHAPVKRMNRQLIGEVYPEHQEETTPLKMKNQIDPNWESNLTKELLRFHQDDTKVFLKKDASLIKLQKNEGVYLEQVAITYLLPNGSQNSFNALVDSQSGKIVETWGSTIHENRMQQFKKAEGRLTLPPANESNITIK